MKSLGPLICFPAFIFSFVTAFSVLFLIMVFIMIPAKPSQAGSIAGHVSNSVSGEKITSMSIEIMDCYLDYSTTTLTDQNGDYIFEGLEAGVYLIRAATGGSGYVPLFYQNAVSYCTATLINLGGDQEISGIDLGLKIGQSISGKVTIAGQNAPAGIEVFAGLEGMVGTISWYPIGEDFNKTPAFLVGGRSITDQNGNYVIYGLALGRYFVGTTPNQGNAAGLSYVEGFFESSHSPYMATLVPVTEMEGPSDIDITLERGGDITGRVRDPNGKSKEGIMITAASYEYWMFEPSTGAD